MKKGFTLLELVFTVIICAIIFSIVLKPIYKLTSTYLYTDEVASLSLDINHAFMILKHELDLCFKVETTLKSLQCMQRLEALFLDEELKNSVGYSGYLAKTPLGFISPKSTFYKEKVPPKKKYIQSLGVSSQLADYTRYEIIQDSSLWLYSLKEDKVFKANASLSDPSELYFTGPSFTGLYLAYKGQMRVFLDKENLKISFKLANDTLKTGVLLRNASEFNISKDKNFLEVTLCKDFKGFFKQKQQFCLSKSFKLHTL